MFWFKAYYQPCGYGRNWYGILEYVPPATVLLYNDDEGYCIGYMDEKILGVEPIDQQTANEYIQNADTKSINVWAGERLETRWAEPEIPKGQRKTPKEG